ncbi:hypothetical protein E1193_08660 [Micromonospora sp. KC606]|uniref:hypothetical protein n=1 Tax=Micromonospora sp. KC606 TaxID=2530379 RepID=UPI00104DCA5B|nr:hypothetical protein [Micromonospora sp. KC606]TDC83507.1 hypothetical protein E1193_08660 [Micromonospora sp. KC606]
MPTDDVERLKGLGVKGQGEIRRWLREKQPDRGSGRAFWWESLATRALHEVYHAGNDEDRRAYASVVKAVTDEAVEVTVLSPVDGAIRIAKLAAVLGEQGRGLFDANEVVKECLSYIGVPFDVAATQASDWRALPLPGILALRRAKNLISASSPLRDRVTDAGLLADLTRWAALRDQLP